MFYISTNLRSFALFSPSFSLLSNGLGASLLSLSLIAQEVTGICVGRIVLSTNKEKKCRYPACGYAERGLTSHCQKKWHSMYVCPN
ncbi:hypothetical protein F5H01DRAFT_341010 [Linnemannia elongata]|nr:hypothetical protein F5H01DRAFT_341010 [Linnemannia elongata]